MNDIRAKFEEIWPVPDGVYWMPLSRNGGEYMADPSLSKDNREEAQFAAEEWDARLDTFTRCQETTEVATEIIFHASNLLNYVRDKYGVIGDDFSCEHMRGIAAAMKRIKE
jgi:hypothetical protein